MCQVVLSPKTRTQTLPTPFVPAYTVCVNQPPRLSDIFSQTVGNF